MWDSEESKKAQKQLFNGRTNSSIVRIVCVCLVGETQIVCHNLCSGSTHSTFTDYYHILEDVPSLAKHLKYRDVIDPHTADNLLRGIVTSFLHYRVRNQVYWIERNTAFNYRGWFTVQ